LKGAAVNEAAFLIDGVEVGEDAAHLASLIPLAKPDLDARNLRLDGEVNAAADRTGEQIRNAA
jgi:hypothetical protein